jgi:penicillin-binding protein 1A
MQSSEVYAADGTLMGKYYSERGNRSVVNYRDISKHVIDALVATEDERFYDHSGIDFKRTLSAIVFMGSRGGGSTITQQLALNLFNGDRASNPLKRGIQKLKEYVISIRLERNFTKEEILALYLNAVPFGDNVYGIRNASRTFFSREPDRLTIEEAAVLVGMLKGNSIYNPRTHPRQARERRNVVLGQMEKNGYITAAQFEKLKAMPINLRYHKMDENKGYAPYFREEVLKDEVRELLKDLENSDGEAYDIYKDGLKIYTTINPKMQQYAEMAMAQQMPMLQKALNQQRNIKTGAVWKQHQNVLNEAMKNSDRWRNLKEEGLSDDEIKKTFNVKVPMRVFAWNVNRETDTTMTPLDSIKYHRQMIQSAFMVMDPTTGEVRAWVGGIDYKTYKFDHAKLGVKRQVGSSIKPLLYAKAINDRIFQPTDMVEDVQQQFGKGQLVPATSKTCTGRTVSMASSLAWSRNCGTAFIMKQVGTENFVRFLNQDLNIPSEIPEYPSICLGACDLSLFEMMWSYTIFPGRGVSTKPTFISRIEDRNGNVIYRLDNSKFQKVAISEATAYKTYQMMQGVVTVGTAKNLMTNLGVKEMGGKTGTTNDNADAWFIGYTPQLLAGVWIGSDDRFISIESAQGYGGAAARPIYEAFFKKALADKTLGLDKNATFIKPADMEDETYSADNFWLDQEGMIDSMDDGMNADDYGLDTTTYIPPESQLPVDENEPKKETKPPQKKDTTTKPPKIGEMNNDDEKKKKGILRRIFDKKEKKTDNDY